MPGTGPEENKETVFPLLCPVGAPFCSLDQKEKASLGVLSLPRAHFCDLHGLEFKLEGMEGKKQKPNQETLFVYIWSFGLLPNLPVTIYFSESSNSYSMHSVWRF